jgi:chemotaxis protein methyltransferase CheR
MPLGTLDPDDYALLRRLVYDKSGLWLADDRLTFLRVRLEDRLRERNIVSPRDYYYHLKFHPDGAEELQHLIDAVTTQETWFFREIEPLETWCAAVVPDVARRNGRLRVWSSACSTGEEAYTLAMLLAERMPDLLVDIQATDISRRALAIARDATYDSHSLRRTDPQWVAKYFRPVADRRWEVVPTIRNLVRFEQANLLDPSVPRRLGPMDAVLCRNVLIYFDDRSRTIALNALRDALRPGGYLVLGFSESLSVPDTLFELVRLEGSVLYRKPN